MPSSAATVAPECAAPTISLVIVMKTPSTFSEKDFSKSKLQQQQQIREIEKKRNEAINSSAAALYVAG